MFLLFPALSGLYWAMHGEPNDVAITRSDDAAAALLPTARRSVAVSRIEKPALVIIIVLMVSRPDCLRRPGHRAGWDQGEWPVAMNGRPHRAGRSQGPIAAGRRSALEFAATH